MIRNYKRFFIIKAIVITILTIASVVHAHMDGFAIFNGFLPPESKSYLTFSNRFLVTEELSSQEWWINYRKNTLLSENKYLIWSPLPLGVGYVFNPQGSKQEIVEWGLIIRHHRFAQWIAGPQFTGGIISKHERLDWLFQLNYLLARSLSVDRWFWEVAVEIGPNLHLSDVTRLGFKIRPQYTTVFQDFFREEEADQSAQRSFEIGLIASLEYDLDPFVISPKFIYETFWDNSKPASEKIIEADIIWSF